MGHDYAGTYGTNCKPWADDFYYYNTGSNQWSSTSLRDYNNFYWDGFTALNINIETDVFGGRSLKFGRAYCGIRAVTYTSTKTGGNITAATEPVWTASPYGAYASTANPTTTNLATGYASNTYSITWNVAKAATGDTNIDDLTTAQTR